MSEGMEPPPPTLAEVAAAAGVSRATASYALNDRPGVSEDTRRRVLATAEQLRYVPRRGASRRSASVVGAVLSPTSDDGATPNYYVSELLAGADVELRQSNVQLRVGFWDERSPDLFNDVELSGMLFLGGSFPVDIAARLNVRTPAVLAGTFFPQWEYDAVLADNSRGGYLATTHLLRRGCRRVALLNGPNTTRTSESKLLGYREALREAQVPFDPDIVVEAEFSAEAAHAAAHRLLRSSGGPIDGIFVADDPMAVGAMRAAADLGISIPESLRIVGYGDSPYSDLSRPTLSTVRVFQQRVGALAARQLLQRLGGDTSQYVRTLVAPEIVAKESSR